MSALEFPDLRRAERRWIGIGVVAAIAVLLVQIVGGSVREALTDAPSRLELVQKCLVERDTPFEAVSGDPIAESATRGSLRARVDGNDLTIALAGSESEARGLVEAYVGVSSADLVGMLLDRRRKVVFLWSREPTTAQRDFAYLCTLDAQS